MAQYRGKTLDEIDPLQLRTFAIPRGSSHAVETVSIWSRRPVQPLVRQFLDAGSDNSSNDPALDMAIVNLLGSLGTSLDYTGDRVWDANVILCCYLLAPQPLPTAATAAAASAVTTVAGSGSAASIASGWGSYSVLELGAGTGLTSLLASRYARVVHATDGNAKTLALLERNIKHNQSTAPATATATSTGAATDSKASTPTPSAPSPATNVNCGMLYWGDADHVAAACKAITPSQPVATPTAAAGDSKSVTAPDAGGGFDVVVGADLVYSSAKHSPILPLLRTVAATLTKQPHTTFWWCHMLRPYPGVVEAISSAASELGLTLTVHDDVAARVLASATPTGTGSTAAASGLSSKSCTSQLKQMRVFEIKWKL